MADITYKAGGTTVKVDGLKKVQKRLREAGADAEDQKDLMHSIGSIIVDAARPKVPERTGALAASIRAGRGKTKAVVRAGRASTPYAGVIHYGWPAHNIAAQPFLTDSLKAKHSQVFDALAQGMDDLIAKNNLD